jgi:ATF/CREB family transcription factor
MFPAPSPNSQALLQQLQSGGATPSTIEFHRTALNAAKAKNTLNGPTSNPTSEPEQATQNTAMDIKPNPPPGVDPFGHHDAADAANGLFMLAKGGQANPSQFSVSNQSSVPPQNIQNSDKIRDSDRRGSHNVNGANAGRETSGDLSDMQGEQVKPTKGKKKTSSTKPGGAANNRRKADDVPVKGSNKKAKFSSEPPSDAMDSEDEEDQKRKAPSDGKKMTDEEKRKNFLERNR